MNIQLLKFIVVALGVLIIAGTVVVGATIAGRLGTALDSQSGPMERLSVSLPPNARIVETRLDGDLLALRLDVESGSRILIVDLRSGRVVSTVDAIPEAQ